MMLLRIFHYSPLIYLKPRRVRVRRVENLSLFAFDILKDLFYKLLKC